ncbi:MAG: hypothetical protein ABW048_13740 [Sphingobium sp.]
MLRYLLLIPMMLTWGAQASAVDKGNNATPILRRLTDCVVAADKAGAVALLNTYPYSDGERRQAAALITAKGACGRAQGRVPTFHLRGSIAESLYRQKFAQAPVSGEVPVVMPSEADWESRASVVKRNQLAACLTSADVIAVDTLVRSVSGSNDEADSYTSLQPALNNCAQKIGSMEIHAEMLRAALAESIYRLALIKANEPLPERPWPPVARN